MELDTPRLLPLHLERHHLPLLGAGAHANLGGKGALADDQGPDADTVARRVTGCSADDAPMVRHAVAGALGRIGGAGRTIEVADAALRTLAVDKEHKVRAEALESLALRVRGDRKRGERMLLEAREGLDDLVARLRPEDVETFLTGASPAREIMAGTTPQAQGG